MAGRRTVAISLEIPLTSFEDSDEAVTLQSAAVRGPHGLRVTLSKAEGGQFETVLEGVATSCDLGCTIVIEAGRSAVGPSKPSHSAGYIFRNKKTYITVKDNAVKRELEWACPSAESVRAVAARLAEAGEETMRVHAYVTFAVDDDDGGSGSDGDDAKAKEKARPPSESRLAHRTYGVTGIVNQGQLCYMNSFLQTLHHTRLLRKVMYETPIKFEARPAAGDGPSSAAAAPASGSTAAEVPANVAALPAPAPPAPAAGADDDDVVLVSDNGPHRAAAGSAGSDEMDAAAAAAAAAALAAAAGPPVARESRILAALQFVLAQLEAGGAAWDALDRFPGVKKEAEGETYSGSSGTSAFRDEVEGVASTRALTDFGFRWGREEKNKQQDVEVRMALTSLFDVAVK
jgi:hypothetical protein